MQQGLYPRVRAALDPLIAVCGAGMVAGGAYLLYAGYIGALWLVALALFAAPLVFPFLMVPAAVFANFMVLNERRPLAAALLQALSVGWLVFVMALWGAEVFDLSDAAIRAGGALSGAALLWGVSGAALPWAVFARGDRDNVFFTGMILMLFLGALAAAGFSARMTLTFWERFGVIAGVMAALAVVQALYEKRTLKKKSA